MKKQKIFNFALSVTCAAVLSACGSSGGGSLAVDNAPTTPSANANANANTGSDNSAALAAAQKAAQEAAAQKAAAEKAAQEAAAKQAAAEEAAKKAQAEADKAKADAANTAQDAQNKLNDAAANLSKALEDAKQKGAEEALAKKAQEEQAAKDKELADKAAADGVNKANPLGSKDKLAKEPDVSNQTNSFVGYKHVVKNDSNLITNETRVKDSTSSTPTPMRVQKPHASLDTIVVAEPVQESSGAPRVYIEDFDTRRTTNAQANFGFGTNAVHEGKDAATIKRAGTIGNTSLRNIYINSVTKDINGDPAIEKQRQALVQNIKNLNTEANKLKGEFDLNEEKLKGKNPNNVTTDKPFLLTPKTEQLVDGGLVKYTEFAQKVLDGEQNVPLTAAERQTVQARLAVYGTQVAELKAANAKLSEERTNLNRKIAAARVEQAEFDALNPKPIAGTPLSATRTVADGKGYNTKTDTQGTKNGGIWTFSLPDIKNKHQNFTEYSKETTKDANTVKYGFQYLGKDAQGNVLVSNTIKVSPLVADVNEAGVNPTTNALASRQLDGTVAEIYGVRTKAYGSFGKPFDLMDRPMEAGDETIPANNLPLVNNYLGDRLKNVQYGRVSSALHGKDVLESYKEGVLEQGDNIKTYVASFGQYGNKETENHYFYRGLNNVGATELATLKADHKNGTLIYEGHAVAYGLDNTYSGNLPVPTALGNNVGFISGNHAQAKVNLATNDVTGSIYNKWFDGVNSPKDLVNVDLVTFKGMIGKNGNIAGTAQKEDDKSSGLFGATLFGKGTEIGGTVASDDKGDKKWGAVFGGVLQVTPTTPDAPAVSDGTDGKN